MPDTKLCPTCASAIPASAPEGLCPKCLWAAAIGPDTEEQQSVEGVPVLTAAGGGRGTIFGDYELLSEIARGGMGVVFRAREIALDRIVALKMILTARLPGEAAMRRFRAEAETIASLDHPNIVPIYKVGEMDGHPYFTMKHVPGGSLADRLCRIGKPGGPPAFDSETIARMVGRIARAVHHAHQRGILHRDLKPSNILLDESSEPLVSDFGLAKQIESDDNLTLSGAVLGTPAYIAPEQASGGKGITTAVDIYSLGAIFYELLAGRPPFQAATPLETLRQVVEQEVRRPASLNPDIGRDLETVCLKCMAKLPGDRYSSAQALAEDLDRWLRHEPIQARRTGPIERALKWSRRHPARAAALLLALIAPIVVIAVLTTANFRVRAAITETRDNLYAADTFLADRALREGNIGLARAALALQIPLPAKTSGDEDHRGFEWRLLWEQTRGDASRVLTGFPRPPTAIAISPDGQTLAIAGQNFLWRWPLGEAQGMELVPPQEPAWLEPARAAALLAKIPANPSLPAQTNPPPPTPAEASRMVNPELIDTPTALAFSHDGRRIVSSTRRDSRAARVWSASDGSIEFAFPAIFHSAAMSPIAPILAVGSGGSLDTLYWGSIRFYDLERQKEIWALPDAGGAVAFSADGLRVATAGWVRDTPNSGQLAIWSLPEQRLIKRFGYTHGCKLFAFSPDGALIALARHDTPDIDLWAVGSGALAHTLSGHAGSVRALAFSHDSQLLATAGTDQIIRLWSVTTGELAGTRVGHADQVESLAFFPGDESLASAARDGTVRLWQTSSTGRTPDNDEAEVRSPIFVSGDNKWWASAQPRPNLKVWPTAPRSAPVTISSNPAVRNVGFDDDAGAIVSLAESEAGRSFDLEWRSLKDSSTIRKLTIDGIEGIGRHSPNARAFSAPAGLFALGQHDGLVRVWSTQTGKLLRTFELPDHLYGERRLINPVRHLALSPDGSLLAAGFREYSQICVFSLKQGKLLHSQHARPLSAVRHNSLNDIGRLRSLTFSPDSRTLVSSDTSERGLRIWDAATGRQIAELAGHTDHTAEAAFSPDGKTLASTGGDGSLKLWHLPTRRAVATLLNTGSVGPVAFSPDGSMLFAALEHEVRIFRARTLAEIGAEQ